MSIEPIESLMPKIFKRYNDLPVGWNVLRDNKGNLLIIGPKEGYMFKIVPINPQESTGVGIKVQHTDQIRRIISGGPSYGFRPLSTKQTDKLVRSFQQGRNQSKLLSKLLEKNPVSITELNNEKPKSILGGPFISHPDLSTISESQRQLEVKLKIESMKLFKLKYPQRASIYG
ncbi:MAG: hypothetical protein P8X97_00885 [Candidatus Bathyarchaeota archaeon]